jgi:hypothetical protein
VCGTPNEIFENGDPIYQSVNYISLIPILIKEIQTIKAILKRYNLNV